MPNDRSDAALHERLEIAGKATPKGESTLWMVDPAVPRDLCVRDAYNERILTMEDCTATATAHRIAANHPDVVRADIEEILRLRQEVARLELENQRLSVDGVNSEAYLLTCLDIIRRAVGMPVGSDWQQVAERVQMLDKEADWFIEYIWHKDIFRCPMPEGYKCEHKLNHICCLDSGETEIRGRCWRKVARKAVEEENG